MKIREEGRVPTKNNSIPGIVQFENNGSSTYIEHRECVRVMITDVTSVVGMRKAHSERSSVIVLASLFANVVVLVVTDVATNSFPLRIAFHCTLQ